LFIVNVVRSCKTIKKDFAAEDAKTRKFFSRDLLKMKNLRNGKNAKAKKVKKLQYYII
jgi:hypothetical protein